MWHIKFVAASGEITGGEFEVALMDKAYEKTSASNAVGSDRKLI